MKDKNPEDTQTVIGVSVKVEGDFSGDGDVIIEGQVIGSIKTKHDLKVGKDAVVSASIEASNASISGQVKGDLKIANNLILTRTSKINGNISCAQLTIEPGSSFNGQCIMSNGEAEDHKTE